MTQLNAAMDAGRLGECTPRNADCCGTPPLRKALRRQAVDLRFDQGVPLVQIAADFAETTEPGNDTAIARPW